MFNNPALLLDATATPSGKIHWKSPSNIAIVKYWGKYGVQYPRNPSISFTLENAFTETILSYEPKTNQGEGISLDFTFHTEENEPFRLKIVKFLESIRPIFPFLNQLHLEIRSGNSFPHSAGIASSASSMSALALCLCTLEDELFQTLQDDLLFDQKASYVARLGSGSACRSIYAGMAAWGTTSTIANASNDYAVSFADEMHEIYTNFHDDILIASKSEKSVSSRAGHALMEGNAYAAPRYAQAENRMKRLVEVLKNGDVETFGEIAENEALTLHALMMTSNPSYILMRPNSLKMIDLIRQYRADTKNPIYFTLDAGPNLHVLYPETVIHEVLPFIEEKLVPLCEEEMWISDWVGEGPEQLGE